MKLEKKPARKLSPAEQWRRAKRIVTAEKAGGAPRSQMHALRDILTEERESGGPLVLARMVAKNASQP